MKRFFLLSAVLAAGMIGLGWRNYVELASTRAIHAEVLATAASKGVTIEPGVARVTKHVRPKMDVASVLDQIATQTKSGDYEAVKREMGMLAGTLNAEEFSAFSVELSKREDIEPRIRQYLITMFYEILADQRPAVALRSAEMNQALFLRRNDYDLLLARAFAQLAITSFPDALAMARRMQLDDTVVDRFAILAARHDPRMAFEWSRERNVPPSGMQFYEILNNSATPEKHHEGLAAFMSYVEKLEDPASRTLTKKMAMRAFAVAASTADFTVASKAAAAIHLTGNEPAAFAENLPCTPGVPARWVEWLGANFPKAESDPSIKILVSRWTEADFQAAGKWLAATPDGPIKTTAIRAYAETVAKADPEVGKQWALTMPPGPEREETLQRIEAK